VALTPLKDCILDIVWELSEIPDSPTKVPGELESLLDPRLNMSPKNKVYVEFSSMLGISKKLT
jgi:hypothetical protein